MKPSMGCCINGFDKVVAVSELIEKECRPFMLRKDKLTCIPNGIDCAGSRLIIGQKSEDQLARNWG